MDRLEAMSVFLAVVEAGSLSGASRKLGAPLPTISRKLSELEAHLNTRLLLRSTRKLSLTSAGTAYVAAAKRILEEVSEAERAASGEYAAPRGELVIAAPVLFGRLHVLPIVTEFLARFAEIDIRLVLSDRNARLIDDHIDMAVRIGALPESSMLATRVGEVRRVVCGSPNYFAAHGMPRGPSDLSALTCVSFGAFDSVDAWSFPVPGSDAQRAIPIRSRLSVDAAEAAIDAAIVGVGVTRVLSYQAARALADKQLQIVLADVEPKPLPVSLVHPAQSLMPQKLRVFLDFLAPRLRTRLEALPVDR
jgi:DNA-binding transcriptional LysR family regulator